MLENDLKKQIPKEEITNVLQLTNGLYEANDKEEAVTNISNIENRAISLPDL